MFSGPVFMNLKTAVILAAISYASMAMLVGCANQAESSAEINTVNENPATEKDAATDFASNYRAAMLEQSPAQMPQTPWTVAKSEKATFGTGCFWCTEAIFEELRGVMSVVSGYSGGHVENPTYEAVCEETTGHAEVVQITFNPEKISYRTLLRAFFLSHDPTSLNKQGKDVGTQYRSAIFYHNEEQKRLAELFKEKFNKDNTFGAPVVTEITEFETFYKAGNSHQDFYALNGTNPYCTNNINPKLAKFRKTFAKRLKK